MIHAFVTLDIWPIKQKPKSAAELDSCICSSLEAVTELVPRGPPEVPGPRCDCPLYSVSIHAPRVRQDATVLLSLVPEQQESFNPARAEPRAGASFAVCP